MKNIIFFGSSSFCLPVLDALHRNFDLSAIITKPLSTPEQFAKKHGILFYTPQDKNSLLSLRGKLIAKIPDLFIVADFGMILPKEIFDIPKHKTLNIHFSKLPDLRGASPVQFTILRGDKSAWISIIIMNEELDTGDIVWQKEFNIQKFAGSPSFLSTPTMFERATKTKLTENVTSRASLGGTQKSLGRPEQTDIMTSDVLYKKLFNIAATELPDVIKNYVSGKLKPIVQNHKSATNTKILTRQDGFIPLEILHSAMTGKKVPAQKLMGWSLFCYFTSQLRITHYPLPIFIDRAFRALTPWPGIWTTVSINGKEKRLKILKLRLLPATCCLLLILVQLEGKNPVSWKQFIEAYHIG